MQKYLPISKKSSTFAPAFRKKACPGGGIGRRVGLKHQWETVPVRSRPWVQARAKARANV